MKPRIRARASQRRMKLVPFAVLVAALTAAPVTGLFRREHVFLNLYLNWTSARTYCRSNYVDLSAIGTEEELVSFRREENWHTGWIGLGKGPDDEGFAEWSDGNEVGFTNWASGQPDSKSKHCVYTYDYEWWTYHCNYALTFYCYTWEPRVIAVPQMKTWDEALVYCRTYHTDLISLSSDAYLVSTTNRSRRAATRRVWTGLRFMDGRWSWVNKQPLEGPVRLPSCPVQPFHCGSSTGANLLENRLCDERMNFVCYDEAG